MAGLPKYYSIVKSKIWFLKEWLLQASMSSLFWAHHYYKYNFQYWQYLEA